MASANEVYLLPLNDNGSPKVLGEYIYLIPKGTDPIIVRFSIEATSSICNQGSLWVNIPKEGTNFDRDLFRQFKLQPDVTQTIQISFPIHSAGSFAFYTTCKALPDLSDIPASKKIEEIRSPMYYIDIAPTLKLDGKQLPLSAISMFSTVSKFMGAYPEDWQAFLRDISARDYNMVHFTPLQPLGDSNSPYSIYDQLSWNTKCFPNGEIDIKNMIESMESDHGLLSLTDVVWNHTANNSPWLEDHPEVGYNTSTAPWLESALELDSRLLRFGENLSVLALPTTLRSVEDLIRIMDAIKTNIIAEMRLWEYYVINVERDADASVEAWVNSNGGEPSGSEFGDLEAIKNANAAEQARFLTENGMLNMDRMGERYRRKVDTATAAALLTAIYGRFGMDTLNGAARAEARSHISSLLDEVNLPFYKEYDKDVVEILQQLFNRIKYVRLDDHGPKAGEINASSPLIESYFTRLPQNTRTRKHKKEDLALVNNGWIWAANALIDNAGPQSRAYLRREVIIWADCVKLRYGSKRDDNPFLWDYMTEYTRLMAKYFSGLRIDNAHSTPIHVSEYLLDEARKIRPNLYVVAELFTGSEEMDYVFVKRLGLSSLIREAMQAWSTGELSRLVHRHGGRPIGSFEVDEVTTDKKEDPNRNTDSQCSPREVIRTIKPTPVHALFMDCTHDNEMPAQKRDAPDTLSNAALVSMCASATGSVMGYDEIYPRTSEIVQEKRLYAPPSTKARGIGRIKKLLNQIHIIMGKDGYEETHIHHEDQYITVHRVHPESRKGYFLIAHTAFPGYGNGNGNLNPVYLDGTRAKHLGSWTLEVDISDNARRAVAEDQKYFRGLPSRVIDLPGIRLESKPDQTVITVRDNFPPGSIALFETWISAAEHATGLDNYVTSGAKAAFADLDLVDLNFALYRCEAEELDSSDGKDGVYEIPGHGKLVYAGLQGWWSILKNIIQNNNLAHPLCQHLRDGQWALDYISGRLSKISMQEGYQGLMKPAQWLHDRFEAIKKIPSFLLPRYFGLVLRTAYMAAWNRGLELMSEHVRAGQPFLQSLAMVSVQQVGFVKSASLWPNTAVPCLAAGLPHFAVSWARCWGRDVFISARGLLLGTGRYAEAKEHILAFSSVLKHGMIPNLLSSGDNPRYNSRDSIWFMLQFIQDYTEIVPNGIDLLKEKVSRRFLPFDDTYFDTSDPRAYSESSTIEDIIQESLQRHASGMSFREANAGEAIDRQMRSQGFQIDIKVDWSNGMIFGGNSYNCGTWMDKMGESERAGSKGFPGTPRDGAAIEITGLLHSTLEWLVRLHGEGKYRYSSVTISDSTTQNISFQDWAGKILSSFEYCYYIPMSPSDDTFHDVDPTLVNRRGIYKDLYRSSTSYQDYQLRPNFPIAMTVAPGLFQRAFPALLTADRLLRGPTGMATLDPSDLNYRPYYNNSEDSEDFHTSKGRNYHQGPEWLWPTGFFLRALLKFNLKNRISLEGRTEAFLQVTNRLRGCKDAIESSEWAGLTELTQKGGEFCGDSSPTQAWSAGCLIDLYHDATNYDDELLEA